MLHRFLPAVVLGLMSATVLPAQPERGIEVYGLSGVFSSAIKNGELKPEFGVGVILPFTRNWAILTDFTVGVQSVDESRLNDWERVFYERNPQLMNNDIFRDRYITIKPSVIRRWYFDSFSFYVGLGWGAEVNRSHWSFQRIRAREDEHGEWVYLPGQEDVPDLIRAEQPRVGKGWLQEYPYLGRFGITADISPKWVLRAGYTCMMAYFDEPLSGAIEIGLGYRF